ncbi:MAG: hypothetical protein WC119_00330 [Synergistaceae bacterium]
MSNILKPVERYPEFDLTDRSNDHIGYYAEINDDEFTILKRIFLEEFEVKPTAILKGALCKGILDMEYVKSMVNCLNKNHNEEVEDVEAIKETSSENTYDNMEGDEIDEIPKLLQEEEFKAIINNLIDDIATDLIKRKLGLSLLIGANEEGKLQVIGYQSNGTVYHVSNAFDVIRIYGSSFGQSGMHSIGNFFNDGRKKKYNEKMEKEKTLVEEKKPVKRSLIKRFFRMN